jgi:hypothetical protein
LPIRTTPECSTSWASTAERRTSSRSSSAVKRKEKGHAAD